MLYNSLEIIEFMDKYYEKTAKGYNELHGDEQRKKLELIKRFFKPKKTDKLLDVGAGTGISSDWDCDVTSYDPNLSLLNQGNKKKVQGYAENMPFKDESFEIVVSLTAIHNFKDIDKGIEEIYRVVKKNVIISILKKSSKKNEIIQKLISRFNLMEEIIQEKDIILILSKV